MKRAEFDIKKGVQKIVDLTPEEIAIREAEKREAEAEALENAYKRLRQDEYIKKGWLTAFDLLDDIIERGIDAVRADRAVVKTKHPKKKAK